MDLQQNMAHVIRAMKEARGQSLTELSSVLEISRSALQGYLAGTGNPNISTIEHMAERMELDPLVLLTGEFTQNEITVLLHIIDGLRFLSTLDPARRVRFAEKLLELVRLWSEEAEDG